MRKRGLISLGSFTSLGSAILGAEPLSNGSLAAVEGAVGLALLQETAATVAGMREKPPESCMAYAAISETRFGQTRFFHTRMRSVGPDHPSKRDTNFCYCRSLSRLPFRGARGLARHFSVVAGNPEVQFSAGWGRRLPYPGPQY